MTDPIERLSLDLQALKDRFDGISLRFAVSEERENRVNDKIDAMAATLNLKLSSVEKTVAGMTAMSKWVLLTIVAVVIGAVVKWALSGGLAGF